MSNLRTSIADYVPAGESKERKNITAPAAYFILPFPAGSRPRRLREMPSGGRFPSPPPYDPSRAEAKGHPWAASAPRFPEKTPRSRRQPPGNLQQRCPGGAAAAGRGEAAPAVGWRCEHCSVRLAESLCQAGSVLVLHERKKRWCWRRGE